MDSLFETLIRALDAADLPLVLALLPQTDDPRLIPALIDRAERSPDSPIRITAITALASAGDARAIEPLIAALGSSDPAVREQAARALGELGATFDSPRIAESLEALLNDSDWGTRQSAAEMLIRLDANPRQRAESLLLADLGQDAAEICLGAAWSLVALADPRAVDPLAALLGDSHPQISLSAALGLAQFGDSRASARLTLALSDPDPAARSVAEIALRKLV